MKIIYGVGPLFTMGQGKRKSSLYPLLSLAWVRLSFRAPRFCFVCVGVGIVASPVWLSLVLSRHTTPSPSSRLCVWISTLKLKEKIILHESITVCVNYLLACFVFPLVYLCLKSKKLHIGEHILVLEAK